MTTPLRRSTAPRPLRRSPAVGQCSNDGQKELAEVELRDALEAVSPRPTPRSHEPVQPALEPDPLLNDVLLPAELELLTTQEWVVRRLEDMEGQRRRLEHFSSAALRCMREENKTLHQEHSESQLHILRSEQQQEVLSGTCETMRVDLHTMEGRLKHAEHEADARTRELQESAAVDCEHMKQMEERLQQLDALAESRRRNEELVEASTKQQVEELTVQMQQRAEDAQQREAALQARLDGTQHALDGLLESSLHNESLREEKARIETEFQVWQQATAPRIENLEQSLIGAHQAVEELRNERAASSRELELLRCQVADMKAILVATETRERNERCEAIELKSRCRELESEAERVAEVAKLREESLLSRSQISQVNVEERFANMEATQESLTLQVASRESALDHLRQEVERHREEADRNRLESEHLMETLHLTHLEQHRLDASVLGDRVEDMVAQMAAVDTEMQDFQHVLSAVAKAAQDKVSPVLSKVSPVRAAFSKLHLSPTTSLKAHQRSGAWPRSSPREERRSSASVGGELSSCSRCSSPELDSPGLTAEPEEEQQSPLQLCPARARQAHQQVCHGSRAVTTQASAFEPAAEPQGAASRCGTLLGESTLTDVSSCTEDFSGVIEDREVEPFVVGTASGGSSMARERMRSRRSQVVVADAVSLITHSPNRRLGKCPPPDSAGVAAACCTSRADLFLAGAGAAVTAYAAKASSPTCGQRSSVEEFVALPRQSLEVAPGFSSGGARVATASAALPHSCMLPASERRRVRGSALLEDSLSSALANIGIDPKVALARADALWEERVRQAAEAPGANPGCS